MAMIKYVILNLSPQNDKYDTVDSKKFLMNYQKRNPILMRSIWSVLCNNLN